MNELIRLAFRIVALGSSENREDLYQRLIALISPLGNLYDFRTNPYPKVANAHMLLIEFDVPGKLGGDVGRILELVGGTGWHRSEDDGVHVAIWAAEPDSVRPISEHVYWAEMQVIPHAQLAPSRKDSPLKQ